MTLPRSAFSELARDQLAVLVPELLLAGHLIDRSGLAQVLLPFGPDGMRDIAIEEWLGASPVYTRRMQRALGFAGDDVPTIFKGLQLDVGAPPQFMDFRYTVHDHNHGEFHLAHCGALMDVEPMGEDFVRRMCHDIEDPTFDGTAIATNPRAQVRPIHRPPRVPADRTPHCAWSVVIDDAHEPVAEPEQARIIATTAAATFQASAIDASEEGRADYSGPLLADLHFPDFSHSALVRIAEEVCLQGHLLTLSFLLALQARTDERETIEIARKQFTGIAGLAAARIRAALQLSADLAGAAQLVRLHPAFNPTGYVDVSVRHGDELVIRIGKRSPAHADGGWPALIDSRHLAAVQAILHAVDPRMRAEATAEDDEALELTVLVDKEARPEAAEVQVTRISTGASFAFEDRGRTRLSVITASGDRA